MIVCMAKLLYNIFIGIIDTLLYVCVLVTLIFYIVYMFDYVPIHLEIQLSIASFTNNQDQFIIAIIAKYT